MRRNFKDILWLTTGRCSLHTARGFQEEMVCDVSDMPVEPYAYDWPVASVAPYGTFPFLIFYSTS